MNDRELISNHERVVAELTELNAATRALVAAAWAEGVFTAQQLQGANPIWEDARAFRQLKNITAATVTVK